MDTADMLLRVPRRAAAVVVLLCRDKYKLSLVADWFYRFGPRSIAEIVEHSSLRSERAEALARDVFDIIQAYEGIDERQSIPLAPAEWKALERIAAETGSVAERGMNAGEPSWRTLLRRIAIGELKVVVTEVAEE